MWFGIRSVEFIDECVGQCLDQRVGASLVLLLILESLALLLWIVEDLLVLLVLDAPLLFCQRLVVHHQ